MESSPTRPVASRPLGNQSSSSTIESRQQTGYNRTGPEPPGSSNGSQNYHAKAETSTSQQHQAPFFERVGVRGDVKVVQNYSRIVKQQNARLREMEKIQKDLEERLELETREKEFLLATLEHRERVWEHRLVQAAAKQEHVNQKMNDEIEKNKFMSKELSKKDQDIHRMMQRKVTRSLCYTTQELTHYLFLISMTPRTNPWQGVCVTYLLSVKRPTLCRELLVQLMLDIQRGLTQRKVRSISFL